MKLPWTKRFSILSWFLSESIDSNHAANHDHHNKVFTVFLLIWKHDKKQDSGQSPMRRDRFSQSTWQAPRDSISFCWDFKSPLAAYPDSWYPQMWVKFPSFSLKFRLLLTFLVHFLSHASVSAQRVSKQLVLAPSSSSCQWKVGQQANQTVPAQWHLCFFVCLYASLSLSVFLFHFQEPNSAVDKWYEENKWI